MSLTEVIIVLSATSALCVVGLIVLYYHLRKLKREVENLRKVAETLRLEVEQREAKLMHIIDSFAGITNENTNVNISGREDS